jgi:DNA-binding CsgD family transcriptional regulator/type II secretory pathway predicted ATPase ExeA
MLWPQIHEGAEGDISMLQVDTNQILRLSVDDVVGQRIAILGMSGSGKTNTVAVLLEELLPHLPLTIVDIEGEYYTLREQFALLIAGRSEAADIPLFVENAAAIADLSLRRRITVVLDLSDYDLEEIQITLLTYFSHLWKLATTLKTPYTVVIEEAHELMPQGQRTSLKSLLTRIALRGRKRGMGVILASQRSAKVEKDILTQANLLFLHHVAHPTDLTVYKDLVPMAAKEVEQQTRALAPGGALFVRGTQVEQVQIRLRSTSHPGATPTLGEEQSRRKTIDVALLEELRELTARSVKEDGSDETSQLRKRLKDAEATIIELQALIQHQAEQIELLSKLSVQVKQPEVSALEIGEAIVQNMHIPAIALHTTPVETSPVVESTTTAKAIEQHVVPINEKKFAALQKRLQQTPQLERDILRVLVEQGKGLSSQEIAAWLNRAESMIQNHPPRALLKLGILTRSRAKHGYIYRSTLAEYLCREFPNADVKSLQSHLMPQSSF